MTKREALNGKPYAGNPHVRFDEGEAASTATSRRGSLLYKKILLLIAVGAGMNLPALSHVDALAAWTRQAVYSHAWETNRLQQLAEDFAKAIEQNPADYDARIFRSIALGLSLAENESAKAYFQKFGYAIDFGGILSVQGERTPAAKWPDANAIADVALAECKPVLGQITGC